MKKLIELSRAYILLMIMFMPLIMVITIITQTERIVFSILLVTLLISGLLASRED